MRVHYPLQMALSDLTPSDRKVIKQCIELIVESPHLMQSELRTRIGLTRAKHDDAQRVLPTLTKVEMNDAATFLIGFFFSIPLRTTAALLLFLSFPKEICFSTVTAQAQAPSSTYNVQPTIPDFTPVSTLITDHKLPCAVVLIGHNNQIVFHQAYGLRKLPGEPGINAETAAEPMTEDTISDMASLTSTARPSSTPTSAPHLIPVSASRVEAWGFSPMNYPSWQNGALAPATTQPPLPKTDAEKRAAQKALKGQLHAPYSPPWNGDPPTLTGIDVLEKTHFAALKSLTTHKPIRIALLTNQSGLDSHGHRTIDILLHADPQIKLVKIFTPEHGLSAKQDTENPKAETDATTNLRVISLYGSKPADRRPKPEDLKDIDGVVIDLQDIGVRLWTYEAVLGYFLEATQCQGPAIVVLDRPNPVGGLAVQGYISTTTNYNSYMPLPVRHGLTYGELARYFEFRQRAAEFACEGSNGLTALKPPGSPAPVSAPPASHLTIIPMQNWTRNQFFADTHLPFTPPSPNMKTLAATILYPGIGLIEQTNISVGRGTDTPFENIGAPYINAAELTAYLTARNIPGITFTPTTLTIAETPEKYPSHGQTIPAIHFTITDRTALDTPELGIEILSALHHLYPTQFQLDKAGYLLASPATLASIKSNTDPRDIAVTWLPALQKFRTDTAPYLLYK